MLVSGTYPVRITYEHFTVLTGLGPNFIKKNPKSGYLITLMLRGGGQKLSKDKSNPRPVPVDARSKA
jgi:hypothetical protein